MRLLIAMLVPAAFTFAIEELIGITWGTTAEWIALPPLVLMSAVFGFLVARW